jgi:hypothetical protein
MRPRLASFLTILALAGLSALGSRPAGAQGAAPADPAPPEPEPAPSDTPPTEPAPSDTPPTAPTTDPGGSTSAPDSDGQPALTPGVVKATEEARFGVGIRLRTVQIPAGLIEVFGVKKVSTSVSGVGVGLELYRRKGDFELQVGFEYEGLHGDDGYWIDSDNTVDFVEFEKFGWFTIEVSFFNHTRLSKYIALRYGGGAGIGILKGDVIRTDALCTDPNIDSTCRLDPAQGNDHNPYDLPPVFPVINAVLGMQFRPIENVIINLEGGIRTAPFFGGTVGYYF